MDSPAKTTATGNNQPVSQQQLTEQAAAGAFSRQAPVFDDLYNQDTIVKYKRSRVREHTETYLKPGSAILELNAGTGEDALYFARKGHTVHATDISAGMLAKLQEKVKAADMERQISHEHCSFTELPSLQRQGPYDHIFSNFAGLNCTNQLEKVLGSLAPLVKTGGHITLVILPQFCLWEFLLMLKGKFKTAFRRFSGSKGARAHIEGQYFRCWYYNPSFVIKKLKPAFNVLRLEGLCTLVPPSYLENFPEKYPRLYKWLVRREDKWKTKWPWRSTGDYYIITLQKK